MHWLYFSFLEFCLSKPSTLKTIEDLIHFFTYLNLTADFLFLLKALCLKTKQLWSLLHSCFLQLYLNQICLITIPQTVCSIACVFFCSRAKLYVPSTINIWKKCAHQSHLGKQEKGWFLAYCLYIKSNWSIKQYRNLGFNLNFPIT